MFQPIGATARIDFAKEKNSFGARQKTKKHWCGTRKILS